MSVTTILIALQKNLIASMEHADHISNPPSQPYPCSTNSDCPPRLWCYVNQCQAFGENRSVDDGKIVAPGDNQCTSDKDCGLREVCNPRTNKCVSISTAIACNLNTDCPQEWFCSNNIYRQYINPPNQPYPQENNSRDALIIAGAIIIGFILLELILRRKKKRY